MHRRNDNQISFLLLELKSKIFVGESKHLILQEMLKCAAEKLQTSI